jgi:hypothetical protein
MSPQPQFRRQETWGVLHEWETVGFGFGRDGDGGGWYAISLYYPDPEAAEADVAELVHRMETYETTVWDDLVQRGWPKHPFQGHEIVSVCYASRKDGSTLTIRYRPEGTASDGTQSSGMWFTMVNMRDLGFLVP